MKNQQMRPAIDLLDSANHMQPKPQLGAPAEPKWHHGAMIEAPYDYDVEAEKERPKFNLKQWKHQQMMDRI
jgi:hypothetical protein